MDKEVFLSGLKAQFEELDSLKLEMYTEFKSMETWDSLTRYSIIAFVEDEYKIILKGDEFNSLNTPNELFDFVKLKLMKV
jgi:acyl carrier protein